VEPKSKGVPHDEHQQQGGAVSVWSDIDKLKAKFDAEMAQTKSVIAERLSKRAAATVRIKDVWWTCTHNKTTYQAATAGELLQKLPLRSESRAVRLG
jgi:peptidyl-tRNA hydrolase